MIAAALGQRPYVEIYGTDYPTSDGTAIRDYIHVTDLAEAHTKALTYLLDGKPSTAINLGTGKGHTVQEVIGAVERVAGRPVPTRPAPRRTGDPSILLADPAKAAQVLNWRPHYTDLDPIVESAWHWHASRLGR